MFVYKFSPTWKSSSWYFLSSCTVWKGRLLSGVLWGAACNGNALVLFYCTNTNEEALAVVLLGWCHYCNNQVKRSRTDIRLQKALWFNYTKLMYPKKPTKRSYTLHITTAHLVWKSCSDIISNSCAILYIQGHLHKDTNRHGIGKTGRIHVWCQACARCLHGARAP